MDLVELWLTAHDIDTNAYHRSGGGDWLTVEVSVSEAERMLGTQYNVYRHSGSDDYVVRALNYSLPSTLHEHVTVVAPTTYFGTIQSMKKTSFLQPHIPTIESDTDIASLLINPGSLATVPSSCSTTITPSCLRALYNTTSYTPTATAVNKLGICGYLEEFANFADLQVRLYRPLREP